MSRHQITVRGQGVADADAVIGYDPPLRTYFLQAFEDPEAEEPGLWLGTRREEFPDLSALIDAVTASGFVIDDLPDEAVVDMEAEQSAVPTCSLVERLGWRLG